MKAFNNIAMLLALSATVCTAMLTSCSDEPDQENFYTFTGEMASDYLKSRSNFSSFAAVVEKASLMDLLASYGHYTCLVPDNAAFDAYLKQHGKSSLDELTVSECDTIARTHLVGNMYSTMDMNGTQLHDANMLHRPVQTIQGADDDGNPVIFLNTRGCHIYYDLKDDSVENAIMQPINQVLESSSGTIIEVLESNPNISTFCAALEATGVKDYVSNIPAEDTDYDYLTYDKYYYTSDFWKEVAWAPETKKTGFTIFVEKDSLLKAKYGIEPGQAGLRALYDLACTLYDPVFPGDVSAEGHKYENLRDSVNPLRRYMLYHFLNRQVQGGSDKLTPLIMQNTGKKLDGTTLGYDQNLLNPVDWHETLLPNTMAKVEYLTVPSQIGPSDSLQRYINRRYDDKWQFVGQKIIENVESEYVQDAVNGHYFYIDDVMAFSKDVQEKVQSMRIRMDFASIFPEMITNDLRQKGNYMTDDDSGTPDEQDTPTNGKNYYFPKGYLKDVTFTGNCAFVYRRPHWNFWSFEGDEFNIFGDYDFTFKIPPVPHSGEWQVRLGFCALRTRGVAQIYFDGTPQGIPMDMTLFITDNEMLGLTDLMPSENETTNMTAYEKIRQDPEQLAESMKAFRNLGIVRGPYGTYHTAGDEMTRWAGNWRTYRRILYQGQIDRDKEHYVRIRVASDGKQGNNNEFMLDYLELVPKSVYEIGGSDQTEDDL